MDSSRSRCSKCREDGHKTLTCPKPWPPHEEQECDICAQEDHEANECKKFNPNTAYCGKCGHNGHYDNACKIKDTSVDANVRQYTKSRFNAVKKAKQDALAKAGQNKAPKSGQSGGHVLPLRTQGTSSGAAKNPDRTSQASSISNKAQSGNASSRGATNTSQASSSTAPSQQDTTDPTEIETDLPITISHTAKRPKPSARDEEKERWAKVRFNAVAENPSNNIQRRLVIQTNFLNVNFQGRIVLHKYRIQLGTIRRGPGPNDIQTITKPEVKRALIEKLLHRQRPPVVPFASDYVEFIISVGPLYPDFTSSVPCAYNVDHLRSTRAGLPPDVLNTIFWFEGFFDTDSLFNYFGYRNTLTATQLGDYHPDQEIRNLNVLSWYHINNDRTFIGGRSGKKFYSGQFQGGSVLDGLYFVHRGIFSSMRPGRDSLLLNINPATTAFFQAINLQVWINNRWPAAPHLPRPHNEDWKELKDVRVTFQGHQTDTNGKRKQWTIFSFLFHATQPPPFQPDNEDGTKGPLTHVLPYMRRTYPTLTFDNNPCWVNCGNTANPKWFPANHLIIAEWQKVKGQVAPAHTRQMLALAQTHASQNKRYIYRASQALGSVPTAGWQFPGPGFPNAPQVPPLISQLSRTQGRQDWPPFYHLFGLNAQWDILKINARYLTQPDLVFRARNDQIQPARLSAANVKYKAQWNLRDRLFLTRPRAAFRLCIIRVDVTASNLYNIFRRDLNAYLNQNRIHTNGNPLDGFATTSGTQGTLGTPGTPGTRATFVTSLNNAYNTILDESRRNNTGDPPLIVVILPKKDAKTYAYLKWWGDCLKGIPTVCVTTATIGGQVRNGQIDASFLGNLSLKINFKLGGISHALADNRQWYGAKPNTMIVGADVTHPGRTANPTFPSLAAVVATRDATSAHYLGSARLQPKNREFIVGLDEMIEERLCAYFLKMGQLPQHILFYRDGVSESQFGMVSLEELPLIRRGCNNAGARANAGANWSPRITLLVVGKRHHTRFYPINPERPGQAGANLSSGLVVDRVVTSPWRADFYLQSHDSALGSAKSAHYIVIENESNYFMDELQELTNKLCYTGQRATKALSVCTPAKYADILCERLRCYIKDMFSHQAPAAGAQPTTLAQYRQIANCWNMNSPQAAAPGNAGPARINPWHPNVDNVMFFL